jgi:hypothetical protein
MQDPEELFSAALNIANQMEINLDGDFTERVRLAYFATGVSVCSIRIRQTAPKTEHLHIVSEYFAWDGEGEPVASNTRLPFYTATYERSYNGNMYDIAFGFVIKDRGYIAFQHKWCDDCADEEFCSKQTSERPQEDFNYLDSELLDATNLYTEEWADYLAEYVGDLGFESLSLNELILINQVYDTWDEIPANLESAYEMYEYDPETDKMVKDPKYCRKQDCDSDWDSDSGIHCWRHEDLCADPGCEDDKEDGPYCNYHQE